MSRFEKTEVQFPAWKMKVFLSATLVAATWIVTKMYALFQGAYESKAAAMQLDENLEANALAHAWASADLGSMMVTFTIVVLFLLWGHFVYKAIRFAQAQDDATS